MLPHLIEIDATGKYSDLRRGVRGLCARFPGAYWRGLDGERGYPVEFVEAMTEAGFLGALIPEEYGGGGASVAEASVILEEVNRSGGNAGVCHAQMYVMGALVRHGSAEQKERWLPALAEGELRLQAFGVTEPTAGSDTTRIQTRAERDGDDLCDHRAEDLDEPGGVFGSDAAAGADDAAGGGQEADGGAVAVSGGPAGGG